MNPSALDTSCLDRTVAELRGSAASWSATPLTERVALLERLLRRVDSGAAAVLSLIHI